MLPIATMHMTARYMSLCKPVTMPVYDFLGSVLGMSEIAYQMRPPKSAISAPQVKWCAASRLLSDATCRLAPKSVTSSSGQHQLPRMLGKAMQMVVARVAIPADTDAVFIRGWAGPQLPLSPTTNESLSDGTLDPSGQRCAQTIVASIRPPVTPPAAV